MVRGWRFQLRAVVLYNNDMHYTVAVYYVPVGSKVLLHFRRDGTRTNAGTGRAMASCSCRASAMRELLFSRARHAENTPRTCKRVGATEFSCRGRSSVARCQCG